MRKKPANPATNQLFLAERHHYTIVTRRIRIATHMSKEDLAKISEPAASSAKHVEGFFRLLIVKVSTIADLKEVVLAAALGAVIA